MLERQTWCDRACEQIRFKPDREAVRRELLGHMEDEWEALRASGLSGLEAERRTLEAMGDPEEVGKLLDRVHRPLLGWLWLASKWAVRLGVIALALLLVSAPVRFSIDLEDMTNITFRDGTRQTAVDTSDGYRFRVEESVMFDRAPGDGVTDVKLVMTVRDLLWSGECSALYEFYAEDDLGNRYAGLHGEQEGRAVVIDRLRNRMVTYVYTVWVQDIPENAQWIELRYDRAGRDIRFRIDLTGGENG